MLNSTYSVPLHLDSLEPSGAPQIPLTLAHRSGEKEKSSGGFVTIKAAMSQKWEVHKVGV
jgi:hypothetical protein